MNESQVYIFFKIHSFKDKSVEQEGATFKPTRWATENMSMSSERTDLTQLTPVACLKRNTGHWKKIKTANDDRSVSGWVCFQFFVEPVLFNAETSVIVALKLICMHLLKPSEVVHLNRSYSWSQSASPTWAKIYRAVTPMECEED